ncbi:hypothetical protein KCU91_g38, partial [Aureobasidium melanogenum]
METTDDLPEENQQFMARVSKAKVLTRESFETAERSDNVWKHKEGSEQRNMSGLLTSSDGRHEQRSGCSFSRLALTHSSLCTTLTRTLEVGVAVHSLGPHAADG